MVVVVAVAVQSLLRPYVITMSVTPFSSFFFFSAVNLMSHVMPTVVMITGTAAVLAMQFLLQVLCVVVTIVVLIGFSSPSLAVSSRSLSTTSRMRALCSAAAGLGRKMSP